MESAARDATASPRPVPPCVRVALVQGATHAIDNAHNCGVVGPERLDLQRGRRDVVRQDVRGVTELVEDVVDHVVTLGPHRQPTVRFGFTLSVHYDQGSAK